MKMVIPGYPKTSAALKKLMPKYQFSRAKWYEANYNWMNQVEVVEWCTEQFGEDGLEDGRWWWLDDRIFISNEADAIWFILRWT